MNKIVFLAFLVISSYAEGQEITVSASSGSGTITNLVVDLVDGAWEIEFDSTVTGSGEFRILVQKTTANDVGIRSIDVQSFKGAGSDASSFVGVIVQPVGYPSTRLSYVHSVRKVGGDSDFKLSVLDVGQLGTQSTSDSGSVIVNQILSLDLRVNPSYDFYTGTLYADLDISAGSLATGAVDNIFLKGSLLGDIIADGRIANVLADGIIGSDTFPVTVHAGGGLGTLNATQGPMGTDSTPVTITTGNNTGIELVTADSIHANITTTGSGDLRRITVRKGDLRGSVDVHELDIVGDPNIPPEIRIRDTDGTPHDLVGTLKFRRAILAKNSIRPEIEITGSIVPDGKIIVGEFLQSGAEIKVAQSQGLEGQIILNSSDTTGTWAGQVKVGSLTLDPNQGQPDQAPYYDRTSAELGGGAIGLARFTLHDLDCVPVNGATTSGVVSSVTLRHYAP